MLRKLWKNKSMSYIVKCRGHIILLVPVPSLLCEPATIVFMTGLVNAGEQVRLIRESHNKYDRWVMSSVSPQLNASVLPRVLEMPMLYRT
jgi:hypothetical protein